jgi:hypothetical protein
MLIVIKHHHPPAAWSGYLPYYLPGALLNEGEFTFLFILINFVLKVQHYFASGYFFFAAPLTSFSTSRFNRVRVDGRSEI